MEHETTRQGSFDAGKEPRTMSTSNRGEDEENNSEDGTLDEGDLLLESGSTSSHHGGSKRHYQHRDHSRWIRPLSFGFSALLLAMVIFGSCTILFFKPSNGTSVSDQFDQVSNDQHGDEMLGIELHPEDHVYRNPKTITYHWTITSGVHWPDGVKKEVYLVNGEFPGPTIECRSGDRLVIHVTNSLESGEGISIHWHGLDMQNSNIMDGAVGLTQCPLPARRKFTYEFQVGDEQAGTFWWHAHSQVQRGDGMYGGLVVHKPAQDETDMKIYGYEREVLLLMGDWYHRSAEEILAWFTSARGFGNEVSANILGLPSHLN